MKMSSRVMSYEGSGPLVDGGSKVGRKGLMT